MPRYFFDTTDAGKTIRDNIGIDLADVEAARKHVGKILPNLARNGLPDGEIHTFECNARDEMGTIVYHGDLTYRGTKL